MAENFQSCVSQEMCLPSSSRSVLVKWKVVVTQKVSKGSILAVYKKIRAGNSRESDIVVLPKLKSDCGGLVKRLLVAEGEEIQPGQPVMLLDVCEHKTIMKDMCAECGTDLRCEPGIPGNLKEPVSASVALVHNIPELRVSKEEAEVLGKKDKAVLLENKKLVLVVDLDQTLIHTTTENVQPDMKDVYHFQLYGQNVWYHTKFRPGWKSFLEDMSKYYELHIFTMGSRMYAHTIARMLDPTGELFADRIRSRDESFDMFSKYRDLRILFPCDDSMVCIIDDREDIWDCAPNLVTVKPYRFFTGTGDINAPPGSEQTFTHPSAIPMHDVHFTSAISSDELAPSTGQTSADSTTPNNDKENGSCENPSLKITVSKSIPEALPPNNGTFGDRAVASRDRADGGGSAVDDAVVPMDTNDVTDCVCLESRGLKPAISKKVKSAGKSDEGMQNCSESHEDMQEIESLVKSNAIPVAETDAANVASEELSKKTEGKDETSINVTQGNDVQEGRQEDTTFSPDEKNQAALYDPSKTSDVKETERHDGDYDDYLLYLEEILRKIHQRFYGILARSEEVSAKQESSGEMAPDLRYIMPELRESVLKGKNVVFTGVIPINCKHGESQIWRTASKFGANVTRDLMTRKNTAERSKRTTHVVAARPGTEKACQATRLPNVHLVNPNWLWTCAERWEFVDERLFPVEDYDAYKNRRHDTPPLSTLDELKNGGAGRNPEGRWGETSTGDTFRGGLNPFLSFSSGEMEAMDKEVEDLMRSSDGEEEECGDYGNDGEFLGSVSSSSGSSSSRGDEGSDGASRKSRGERNRGEKMLGMHRKGKTVNFSTIKQTLHHPDEAPAISKIRKLDFKEDDESSTTVKRKRTDGDSSAEEGTEGEFSSDDSGSSDDDDGNDDNKMAAMLEAAIYQ